MPVAACSLAVSSCTRALSYARSAFWPATRARAMKQSVRAGPRVIASQFPCAATVWDVTSRARSKVRKRVEVGWRVAWSTFATSRSLVIADRIRRPGHPCRAIGSNTENRLHESAGIHVRLNGCGISPSAAGLRTRTDLPPVAANDAKAKERQAAVRTVACREEECHVKTRPCAHARRRDVTVQPRYHYAGAVCSLVDVAG